MWVKQTKEKFAWKLIQKVQTTIFSVDLLSQTATEVKTNFGWHHQPSLFSDEIFSHDEREFIRKFKTKYLEEVGQVNRKVKVEIKISNMCFRILSLMQQSPMLIASSQDNFTSGRRSIKTRCNFRLCPRLKTPQTSFFLSYNKGDNFNTFQFQFRQVLRRLRGELITDFREKSIWPQHAAIRIS